MQRKVLESHLPDDDSGHKGVRYKDDADIADGLEVIKAEDEERFFTYLDRLPPAIRAQTVVELPAPFQDDLVGRQSPEALAEVVNALETDDATDLMQRVRRLDGEKAEAVFEHLDDTVQQDIRQLMTYAEDEVGSVMQTEVFTARQDETIQGSLRRLKRLKAEGWLQDTQEAFVVDGHKRLLRVIPFSELILHPARTRYQELLEQFSEPYTVLSNAHVEEAVRTIERYDLTSVAVVDRFDHLLGRVTHDDVVDLIQSLATEQMYALGRVSAGEELHEGAVATGKSRALWLGVNLVNAVLASIVIGLFEDALSTLVALAVLMPIVANMAGTASVQTLTVVVRQLALGELTPQNAAAVFTKELNISALNGVLFGLLSMAVSYVWFGSVWVGVAMALSMFISFFSAGLLGAGTPVVLRRVGVDPAIASSVIVITLVDIIGFFSFLGLAQMLALP